MSEDLIRQLKSFREYFHKYPELSFKESNTAAYIQKNLANNNIESRSGIAGNGILAVVKGNRKGKTIAFRADMDALPVSEKNDMEYKSCNEGVMHACGHDFHMATLLSTLLFFKRNPDKLNGTLLGIFQPAEEQPPGGAKQMLEEGVFEFHEPDAILAIHAAPDIPAGFIGLCEGYCMASADEISIKINGKGGHGALTHLTNDPILAAAHFIIATEQINSRMLKAGEVSVLSFGRLIADTAPNVIPDSVTLAGTFRCFNEEWRLKTHQKLKDICKGIGQSFDVQIELKMRGYPTLFNDVELTNTIRNISQRVLGNTNVILESFKMSSEDFSYFAMKYPSCMIRVGTASADGSNMHSLHSPYFDIDDKAYKTAFLLLTETISKL